MGSYTYYFLYLFMLRHRSTYTFVVYNEPQQ